MAIVFWGLERSLVSGILGQRRPPNNSWRYVETFKKLKRRFQKFRPNRKMYQDPLMPIAPNLSPPSPDLQLFGPLKDALRGHRFADDKKAATQRA